MSMPLSDSSLVSAVVWTESILTGSLATTLATLAIAVTGFAMLTGRINWQRGLRVVLGCFVLFGAPVIVAEIRGLDPGGGAPVTAGAASGLTLPDRVEPRDPYAGASLPMDKGVQD